MNGNEDGQGGDYAEVEIDTADLVNNETRHNSARLFTQSDVDKIVAQRLDKQKRSLLGNEGGQHQAPRTRQPQQRQGDDLGARLDRIEQALMSGARPAQAQAQEPAHEPTRPQAVASRAPQKVDEISANGLVDIFSLSAAQIDQLGPVGLRQKLEMVVSAGHSLQGRPPVPKPGRR